MPAAKRSVHRPSGRHVDEERSKRRRGGGDRHAAPTLRTPHRKEGIHLFEADFSDGATLLTEPMQERLNVPATVVDGVWRQATLQAHVVGELVDEFSACAGHLGRCLQACQEAKPVCRDLYEPLPAEPGIANAVMTSLMTNPAIGRRLDLVRRDGCRATDVDPSRDQQKLAGQTQQRRMGGAGVCTVSQKSISLFG